MKNIGPPAAKPILRGYLHQEAFFISLGACLLLVAKASDEITLIAALVYSTGLLLMFGISALYHRVHWQVGPRALMKRLDHSAIFIQIAGCFTPLCLLVLSSESGHRLLIVIWIAALIGIMQSIFWVGAPKWVTAFFYILMGWFATPYLKELNIGLGPIQLTLLIAGGIFYTVGAVFYAMKRPDLVKNVFGYHELFHLFTIIAAALHFLVIYPLIK